MARVLVQGEGITWFLGLLIVASIALLSVFLQAVIAFGTRGEFLTFLALGLTWIALLVWLLVRSWPRRSV